MDIQHVERDGRGGFLLRDEDGKRVGELLYVTSADPSITIDHTEVDPELRGKGLATKLLRHAVQYARNNDLKIRATCPFALKKLQEEPEFGDVYVA